MRQFLLLAFIGVLLMKDAVPKNQRHPSRPAWLFHLNNKPTENKENKEENKPTVCQSLECKKIAQTLSESMDKSVDPCDDFYEYACGKWPEHNPIPEGERSWGMYDVGTRIVMQKTKEIFDEGPKDDDILAVKLAKKWYAVCMDTDAMDRQGLEPLVFTLARIGGWPMIMEPDEWNEEEYSWQKVDDQYMRLTGRNAFHDVRVMGIYSANESQKAVDIDTPHLPPNLYKVLNEVDYNEEKDTSNEDPSDEENQSNEQTDSEEPGSEGEDHDKSGNNSNDNNEDDNDDDDDDADDHGDTNKQDDDKNAKKKVGIKKTGKFTKNKKVVVNKKIKNSTHSKKYENHKSKKQKIKRGAIPTNVREKLRPQKNEKNHMKQTHRKSIKKILEATTQQISTEETINEEDEDERKQYTDYISKVARAIAKARGFKVSKENMNKDIQDIIDFQVKLYKISTDFSDDKEMTLNDFQKWYNKRKPRTANSAIDWMYKIGELFDEAHVTVDGDLNLRIWSPGYFKKLVGLLDESSSRTIVNYIHWNFLSRIIRTTTNEMRKLYNAWKEIEETDNKDTLIFSGRSEKCTEEIEMRDLLAYEYVRNNFPDEIKIAAADMMDDIQKEVEYLIKESDWMDDDTKDFVLAKLVNMKKFIGYPDWYRNDTIVKRYFQGLIIGNSYYENTLSNDRYSKWKELRKLTKEDEDDEMTMEMSPLVVNAAFSPWSNYVELPAANFENPFFAYGRPQAINYGIVGSTMGHEVNHGFDNDGHLYDKNGKYVEWLSEMAKAYGKRAGCFVEQFNNYPIDKESNYTIENYGNKTAGENIADSMGLEATFRAYRRRERECRQPDTVLPGLEDLTNDQLFFLSFAFLSCEVSDSSKAQYDSHSPERLRVIGSVSNSQDFAKAYNCPVGSAMNPEKKCNIWK